MPQVSFFEEKEETRVLWKKLASEKGSPRFFIEVAHAEAASYFICIVNSITAY